MNFDHLELILDGAWLDLCISIDMLMVLAASSHLGYKAGLWICIHKLDSAMQTVQMRVLPSARSEDAHPSI